MRRAWPITRSRLGIPATIVMPVGTPMVKIENTRRHGAETIISGKTLEEAAEFARAHGKAQNLVMIHPYDDPLIIAGQGTIALEMLAAVPQLDTLVVPIGGGGLISGIAVAAKSLKPALQIIGVQAQLYPSMYNAIKGEQPADARRHAGRRHRRQGAGPASPPTSSAVSSTTSCSSPKTRSSARWRC